MISCYLDSNLKNFRCIIYQKILITSSNNELIINMLKYIKCIYNYGTIFSID